ELRALLASRRAHAASLPVPSGLPEAVHVIAAVTRGQQLAYELARARHVNPDAPAHLSKVTATTRPGPRGALGDHVGDRPGAPWSPRGYWSATPPESACCSRCSPSRYRSYRRASCRRHGPASRSACGHVMLAYLEVSAWGGPCSGCRARCLPCWHSSARSSW